MKQDKQTEGPNLDIANCTDARKKKLMPLRQLQQNNNDNENELEGKKKQGKNIARVCKNSMI